MIQQRIAADGMVYPLSTFLDAYGFQRFDSERELRPFEKFEVVTDDGRLIHEVEGYAVPALRPVAIKHVWSGGDVIEGYVAEPEDDWEDWDDDDCCPHCGHPL